MVRVREEVESVRGKEFVSSVSSVNLDLSVRVYLYYQYNRIKGNNINVGYIYSAMVIIPFNLCKNIKWN